MTTIRTYQELLEIPTHEGRYDYLRLNGSVGFDTFGFERFINQKFYASREWKLVRQDVIARDLGCDLGVEGYEIHRRIIIHHMNPMTPRDIIHDDSSILDPNYLITVSHNTHNAIHYGDASQLVKPMTPRLPGDTKLW